jgi:RNA polymerase sigma-70 factor (ECF subfamily)
MRAEVEQAAELVRRGDADAIAKAVALLQGTVYSFSMKVCGHREDAEDTMQETLLRVSPMLKKISNPKALAVWLYKVARSRCLMSRRRSKFASQPDLSLEALMPDREDLEALAADREKDPESSLLSRESSASLRAAIDKLPPEYRLVLVLHDMEELSTEEIAKISGLKPGTVRVRLHRARLFLRNELSTPSSKKRKPARRTRHCRELFSSLSDFIDQQLPPDMCEQLEAHMEGCRPCETFLESLRQIVTRCRDFQPDGCAAKVRSLIKQYRKAAAQ